MPAVALPWFANVFILTDDAMVVKPVLVIVNLATLPSSTSISLISYMILGSFVVSLPGNGTPPTNPIVVNDNGFPVKASSQVYCV